MTVNATIDERLLQEAISLGHHPSQDSAIDAALNEYVRMQRRRRVAELIGTIDFGSDFKPRAIRGKPPCES